MFLKLLVGSRSGAWFAGRKVSAFLTACVVACCDTGTEQVAVWEEMCLVLEHFFFFFLMSQGTSAICLPSLKVVLSAFLEMVDLSQMFTEGQGRGSALLW